MNYQKCITTLGVAALLAGCSGGGASAPTSPQSVSPGLIKSSGASRLAIKIDRRSVLVARRSPKQISTGVDTIDINVAGQDNFVLLSDTSSCTPLVNGAQTCTIALAPGTGEAVAVSLLQSTTSVGVSAPQTLSFTAGATTSASFTITPIVNQVTASAAFVRLPEDAQQHTDAINVFAVDILGNTVTGPVDPTVFGSVMLGSSSGSLSPSPATFTPDVNGNFSATATLTYAGDAPAGDQIVLTPTYTSQPGFAFAGTSEPQSVLLASLALPDPSTSGPGTFGGNTLTFSGFGSFSGLAITEKNAGAAATGSLTVPGSTVRFEDGTIPCGPTVTITPVSSVPVGNNITATFSVAVAAGAQSCNVKLYTSDWGDSSIAQVLNIVPPAQAQITTQ